MRRYIFSNICVGLLMSISLVACKQTATVLPSVATQTPVPVATASPEGPIKIRWFIGVSTGRTPDEVNTAREFVKEYNESQGKIELDLEVVTTSTHDAIDRLLGEIEAGNPPDIVAPADKGWAGEQLTGYTLALEPAQVEAELADINVKVLDTWREAGKFIGIPAGVYPSAIFYNKSLFDAAKLPYPPHRFGEPYADGEPWTIEKMEEIALQLTLDFDGRNASAPGFDASHVTQWGFHWQWDSTRSMAVIFGAGSVMNDQGNAVIPEQWREAFHWYYDGMWQKHFIPTTAQTNSLQRGNPFFSGKVAMVHTFLWYSPRLAGVSNWDLAAVPAYQGTITTRMEQDGIIILNTTQHPKEAMDAAYAIANSRKLLLAWEMLPTNQQLQPQFLEDIQARHPGVDWQVMVDSTNYADTTYESLMPNYRKSYDRLLTFRDLMGSKGSVSLDEEMDRLAVDLQALFDAAP
jgi:multiple sugar transport system substrate-binding protein